MSGPEVPQLVIEAFGTVTPPDPVEPPVEAAEEEQP